MTLKTMYVLAINTKGGDAMWWLKLGFSLRIFIGLYLFLQFGVIYCQWNKNWCQKWWTCETFQSGWRLRQQTAWVGCCYLQY